MYEQGGRGGMDLFYTNPTIIVSKKRKKTHIFYIIKI